MPPVNSSDAQAAVNGIDTRSSVRKGLIDWRTDLMTKMPGDKMPDWGAIVLLTHAIWWLSAEDEKIP